jgi:DNA-binding GntR family transcriptional regulator
VTTVLDHSLKQLVAERIRTAIIGGDYKPGTHLTEQSVAGDLGISRGPVREAFLQLQQEGLVKINPRRGCEVTPLSLAEAAEFYVLRGHLEGLAIRLARPNWTQADTDALSGLVDRMRTLRGEDWQGAINLDMEFHHRIVGASRSGALIQMYRSMDSKIAACFMTVRQHLNRWPPQMAERHLTLANVLAEGDFWRAEYLAAEHWADTAARFRALDRPALKGR